MYLRKLSCKWLILIFYNIYCQLYSLLPKFGSNQNVFQQVKKQAVVHPYNKYYSAIERNENELSGCLGGLAG